MSDLTDTTGSAFLGLTFSCCKCHDHKFDPLLQADYYRLRAFFEPVKYADDRPIDLAHQQKANAQLNAAINKELSQLEKEKVALTADLRSRLITIQRGMLSEPFANLIQLIETSNVKVVKSKLKPLLSKMNPTEKQLFEALGSEQKKKYEAIVAKVADLQGKKRSPTLALMMTDAKEKVPVTHILYQGDYRTERDAVEPGIPSILDPNDMPIQKPINSKTTGRRLTFAHSITSADNPLTARVFVNRLWQGYFGKGLVETANDFGLSGSRPSHPELLDWLAHEFMNGSEQTEPWSMKRIHRLIVTSATYRQSSIITDATRPYAKVDAENMLYWRQNPRRLSAEQLRDALLSVSTTLKKHQGGPPIWPTLPAEILQANPAFLDDNAERTKGWYESPKELQNVRSIYLVQKRTVRVPFLETFDQPENTVSCARRTSSTVAPQALSLLNGSLCLYASRTLANETTKTAGSNPIQQIDHLYRCVFQRATPQGTSILPGLPAKEDTD